MSGGGFLFPHFNPPAVMCARLAKLYTRKRLNAVRLIDYSFHREPKPWFPESTLAKIRTAQRLHLITQELRLRVSYGLTFPPNARHWEQWLGAPLADLRSVLGDDAPAFFVSRVVVPMLDRDGFRFFARLFFFCEMKNLRFAPDLPKLEEIEPAGTLLRKAW